jgi:DNA (cytosine-5)-methyltransferase 1
MKVLNLYSGIGGNRKLWKDVDITAVEYNKKIAKMYQDSFPNDTVIIADALEDLLNHYKEYDFIWSSPPCQTHSRTNYFTNETRKEKKYADMSLYEEIIYLTQFFKGKFCVENVISYYQPLIKPQQIGRHYLWANFKIPKIKQPNAEIGTMEPKYGNKAHKIPLEERNAVNSELGLHILNCAKNIYTSNKAIQIGLFK